MMGIPNFTLEDMHCTACFFKDKESGSYKVELSAPEQDKVGSIMLGGVYDLRKMGESMMAMADKADKLIPFVWGDEAYEVL